MKIMIKSIILSLLLATPIMAQNIFVIVLTDTNQLPAVLHAITNAIPSVVIHKPNPKITELQVQIRLMEKRFKEVYEGVPTTFTAPSNLENDKTLDYLILIWKQKDVDAEAITKKKEELKKLQN
jgi:hypothetical protein